MDIAVIGDHGQIIIAQNNSLIAVMNLEGCFSISLNPVASPH